ncbi:MAG: hypothetical protein ACOY5F_14460 [Pseudomonadota bacterium]
MILRGNLARHMMSAAVFNAEGGGGGGGGDKPAATPPAGDPPAPKADPAKPAADPAASVLFPNEGEPKPAAGDPPKEGDKTKAEDWKEYVADPKKSEAENAAAKAEHDKTKPAAADPLDTVPADGKYTLTMPEGVQVDQELIDALGPEFKEIGLTGKQAQKLADTFTKIQTDRAKAYADKPEGQWSMSSYAYFQKNGTPDKWADTAKADKDIGGTKWDGTVNTAVRAVNTLGTPGLKEYFEASGAGNHPEVIRFMAKVGAMIKEDNPADGGAGGSGKPVDAAHMLFPNDAPKG